MPALSRTAALPFLFLFFAASLQASSPTVSGVVVNEAGAPVAGAEVVAIQMSDLRRPQVSTRADASGRFRMQVEDCGQVVLKASWGDLSPSLLNVDACMASPDYRIVLRPGVAASGRVAGADGRPVAGAGVELFRPGALPKPGPHRATTGEDGRFTVTGLLPGTYALRVAHPEHPRLHQAGIDIPDGTPKVDLGGFSLRKAERVEGQVVDQEGRPVAGVRILQDRSGPLEIAAAPATGPDGRFVLPEVIVGRLTLCKEGYDSSWGPLASPSQLSKLARIVLRPAAPPFRVSGRVVDGEGRPVAGARVRSGPHESGCVVATLIDPCTGEVIPDQVVASGADGRFSLEIHQRHDFDFRAEAPGYVPAVQSRVMAHPGQSAEVEMVLRRSLTVTGRVLAQDGSPATGVRVSLFPDMRGPEAVTDAQGRYRLEGIAPRRQAFEAKHPKLGRALRRLEAAPGSTSLDFRLDGVAERVVTGRVLDPDGKPLPGANVEVEGGPLASSAADGRFRLVLNPYPQLTDQKAVKIRASRDGYVSASRVIRLSEAPLQGLEIRLGPGQSVTGRLLGVEDSEHLANASVEARKGEEIRNAEVTREGRYRLSGLGPGEWTVLAHVQRGRSAATRVLLEPGQVETLLDLEVSPHLTIQGRILGPDGTPVRAQVGFARAGEPGSSIWSDEEGRFSIAVPSGTYSIVVTEPRYAPARLEAVAVAEPLDGLEIRLRPGLTLTGRIAGLPPGVHAAISAQQDGIYRRVETGPDGAYRFDNLGPGEWKLTALVSGEGFYRSREERAIVSPETAGARFDFDLALGSASLSGKLGPDEEPILAGLDLLSPEGGKVAETSAGFLDGEFRFPHLRPGSYVLRITDRSTGRVLTREVEVSGSEEIAIDLRK